MTVQTPVYIYAATVKKWVDGDTVDLRVDLGFRTWIETRFRLYGIDTPERGQPLAKEASAEAAELAPAGAEVVIETYKDPDKYGRWLADITTASGCVVNAQLIADHLAVPYFGGHKETGEH